MPKSSKVSFNKDSVSLDDSMNSEDQKDVLKQLAALIAIQVESTKESNKISRLEFKRNVEKDKAKKIVWESYILQCGTNFSWQHPQMGKNLLKSCQNYARTFTTRSQRHCRAKNLLNNWEPWAAKM